MNAIVLVAGLLTATSSPAASFDCKKAATAIEKKICGDAELSALDGQLASAYRRALSISPRPYSLKSEQQTWLTRERNQCPDAACLKKVYGARLLALAHEKEDAASFDHAPFVSPRLVQDLTTLISDQGDQVLAVCLGDSQSSNRYAVDDVQVTTKGPAPEVFYETPVPDENEPPDRFGYRHIGKTTSGVDVLLVESSGGGGTGVFESLLLVTVKYEETGMSPRVPGPGGGDQTLTFKRKRLVIERLGEVPLGDRWNGDLAVTGNQVRIGKDKGWFSDRYPSKPRVITIDYQP